MPRVYSLLFVCLLCVSFWGSTAQAGNTQQVIQAAEAAYYKGNYAEQYRLLGSIMQSSPEAEWRMGDMHERGLGRPKNNLLAFQSYAHAWVRGYSPGGNALDARRVYSYLSGSDKNAANNFINQIRQRYGKTVPVK